MHLINSSSRCESGINSFKARLVGFPPKTSINTDSDRLWWLRLCKINDFAPDLNHYQPNIFIYMPDVYHRNGMFTHSLFIYTLNFNILINNFVLTGKPIDHS